MKILHLIDSGGLYGAEKMLLSLIQEQIKQGLEPMILSAGEPGIDEKPIEKEARFRGLPVMPWRMKPGLNLNESRKILTLAKKSGYDLLHSHGFKFNVLLGMYPERFRRIPMVATLHGYVHAPLFSKLWLYEILDRFAIRRMRGVVLVGEAMRSELPCKSSTDHVVVIPNGLNIDEVQAASRKELGEPFKSFIDNHNVVILGVGRLSQEKGFDRLISAFSEFRKQKPGSGLIIVGEGGFRQQFEKLIGDLNLEGDVLLPGYCSTVPSLMSRSNLLVMPSLTEGLPITLLEAIALKTSVVASAVGEMPKVLCNGQGGRLLSEVNPESICKAISDSIADNKDTDEKIVCAYDNLARNYSSEAMAVGYLGFYYSALTAQGNFE